ncbi:MAG TPA: peptidylprolyl isomerase [Anaerolineaceae bacterium]
MAKTPTPKHVTQKHLARMERERIQRRYLLIGTIAALAVIVAVIVYGIVDQTLIKPNRPVAKVDGEAISLKAFQSRVKFSRIQMINQYQQYYQFSQYFGQDPNTGYFASTLQSLSSQLQDTNSMGSTVVDQLVNERLIAHEAEKLGISVSDAEVEKRIQEYFSFYPDGTPTPAPTEEIQPTSTLSATQMALVPPTEVPTETLEATAEATPEGTPAAEQPTAAATEAAEPTADVTATPEPTATPYTQEGFETTKKDYFTSLAEYGITEDDLNEIFYYDLLRTKMLEEVTKDTPKEEEQVWARHILVADEATAKSVLERLSNGEDFAALAAELSTDSSNAQSGGDLGWFNRSAMVAPFADAAFSLGIGEISQPVQSDFGWHIIQVLGHEVRPLSADEMTTAKESAFEDWLTGLRDDTTRIVINDDVWQNQVPTEPAFTPPA